MMWLNFFNIVLLSLAIRVTYGSHFRGGSMSWQPIGNNMIKLKYRVGFKLDHTEPGFEKCTNEAWNDRTKLGTSGKIKCDSCSDDEAIHDLDWICDDFDVAEDSAMGHNTVIYHIPEGHPEFTISYEHCCWIDLQSPVDRTGGAKGWKMLTHVNVQPRPDGQINSSPVTAPIPLEKFYKGCQYHIRLPVSDPENDAIRCRFAKSDKGECPKDGNTKACGPKTDGLTINKKDCTLDFDTRNIAEGYHAVNAIIEDYIRPVKKKSQALSKISLLFLLLVESGDSDVCSKPMIIDPPSCRRVRPGEYFEMVVRADPGDPLKPISKIRTQKPYGMWSSVMEDDPEVQGRKKVTLAWYPTPFDLGEHSVCFSALDSESYTSGLYCTFIYVDDNPLQPDPENSSPAVDEGITAGETWIVQFNKQIQRPKMSAFIKIVDAESNNVAFEIDTSKTDATFIDNRIEFAPPREALIMGTISMKMQYKLQIEVGVAMPKAGGCASEAAEWQIEVNDNVDLQPGVVPTPGTGIGARPFECNPTILEIIVPNEIVKDSEDCSLHLPEGSVEVSGEITRTPYTLCCPSTCDQAPQGGSHVMGGPPGGQAVGPPGNQYISELN